MKKMIELDGATGEGGGQILRTALTLSMITGQPFRMTNIRASRPKPGLMRQHLVAVQAAAAVCGADLGATAVGATALEFVPGPIKGGDYEFAIGSAGSCTLVLQTLVPALLYANAPSRVRISGGTHNPMAPTLHFLQRAYGRVLKQMGAAVSFELHRFGFYPAGGGAISAHVTPCARLQAIDLMERGGRGHGFAECFTAGIPFSIAERELECVGTSMGWGASQLLPQSLPADQGPGNVLQLTLEDQHVTNVFTGFGEKTTRAEAVAKNAVQDVRHFMSSGAAVDEHLADQIMLPMALARGGRFTASKVSQHALTNAQVIMRFLPVEIAFADNGEHHICTLTDSSADSGEQA